MRKGRQRRRVSLGGAFALALLAAALGPLARGAGAATPTIGAVWSSAVFTSTARLSGEVNPNNLSSGYHFDYIAKAAYDANLAASKSGFAGAARTPALADAFAGSGGSSVGVLQLLSNLAPDTTYHYRLVATNGSGTALGPDQTFSTFPASTGTLLADGRGWEMVSPVDKNGGRVDPPATLAGGGVIQAAAAGGAVTYSSAASFAGGAAGATSASQYVSSRSGTGWSTQNITAALFSGSYDTVAGGAPYRLFSGDLARSVLLNGDHCRGGGGECAVANPPLAGTDAPAGYQNYYLREGGGFTALLGNANAGFLSLDPAHFDLRLAGTSRDLRHPVVSTCAKLTANATQVAAGEGCDPSKQNLYEYAPGSGLSLLNLPPGGSTGAPGAALAAQVGAVSEDGSRVYFESGGNLYLRAGGQTAQVDADAGGGGAFQAASIDGTVAFFLESGHLWRYLTSTGHATDLTPGGGVEGVLGASDNGTHAYYQDASALRLWNSGATSTVASGAQAAQASGFLPDTLPQATGTARVSADGTRLLFLSDERLTGYDNTDLNTKAIDGQAYLYDATGASLICVSCNPSNGRPVGPSWIPGATQNGTGPDATFAYEPRVLSDDGRRAFFESSDALVLTDTNSAPDAYEWEAQGKGSCNHAGGCVSLISSGRAPNGGLFVDASAEGADAYFITDESLASGDLGSGDLYDARVGGGFPVPAKPIPCTGDSCQVLPPEPTDPTLTTQLPGLGNPPVRYPGQKKCPKGKRRVENKGKVRCVKERRHRKRGGRRRSRERGSGR